ncbi:MAG: YggS family pyridoxal phosphate-dependent enzyme [Actinomycetota bacterium]|nr:YggS family pyridoxal phosphate-dependent enzyme [Actinomycetota bacterium]MDH5223778.1 YggS family pyridoxal phosphate-dependent enzyme [Actinomycetota bacterium]MDH5312938.1 YggS family pyridoxal phosphate-dependent enzyme [Actinomycetota bacterium]
MHGTRDEILRNLTMIRERIAGACDRTGRDPSEVTLVAAAKTRPAEQIRWVVEAGTTAIGQNYVRELRDVRDAVPGARWHYIGTLQTNSAHHVAALADVVETLSGDRAIERLARRAAEAGRTLDALIEVDFTGERAGVSADEVLGLTDRVAGMRGLRLRGLMTLPPLTQTASEARPWFRRLRELRDLVRENHSDVVDLSMGMSLDYEAAVEEGATMVRIGTALFGPRSPTGGPIGAT